MSSRARRTSRSPFFSTSSLSIFPPWPPPTPPPPSPFARAHPHTGLTTLRPPSQAAYRKTTEGAGHVAQARQLLGSPAAPMQRAAACRTHELRADWVQTHPSTHTHPHPPTPTPTPIPTDAHRSAQVARKLATNLGANRQAEFATESARAHAADSVYHKVFKLLSQVSTHSLASSK